MADDMLRYSMLVTRPTTKTTLSIDDDDHPSNSDDCHPLPPQPQLPGTTT